jgi:hypothetical protein
METVLLGCGNAQRASEAASRLAAIERQREQQAMVEDERTAR